MRDPLTDPQPGDIIQLSPMWQCTVTKRTPRRVWFRLCFEGRRMAGASSVCVWRAVCGWSMGAVLRRAEGVDHA